MKTWTKYLKKCFTKEYIQMANELMKIFRISYQGNAHENHNAVALYTCFKIKKTDDAKCWQ